MYECHQLSFFQPKMQNVRIEPKTAKRIQSFGYLLLDQPTMRLRNADHAFCVCHLLPMSWPCLLPMSWPRTLPNQPETINRGYGVREC
jgi:hypothetical protein